VLRERLEVVERDLGAARARETERRALGLPLRIGASVLGLGTLLLVGWGFVTYRELEADLRERDRRLRAAEELRQQAEGERAAAEQALVAAEVACRDRAELERTRSAALAARAWTAGPSPPPSDEEHARFFWITQMTGRDDIPVAHPCVVTLFVREHFAARLGHDVSGEQCELDIVCGAQNEITVVPNRLFDCRERADGWVDARHEALGIDLVMAGARLTVRDPSHGWSMSLENTRPCGR